MTESKQAKGGHHIIFFFFVFLFIKFFKSIELLVESEYLFIIEVAGV